MFNLNLFNTAVFNQIPTWIVAPPQDDFVYNDFGLHNDVYKISNSSFDNGHRPENATYFNPLADLGGQLSYRFRNKIVRLEWRIKTSTALELNEEIDKLKRILSQPEKDLDIRVNGNIRRAKASCININSLFARQHYNITWLPFTLEFEIISQFSREITRQSTTENWLTATSTNIEINNRGTVKTNPTISILFNSATSVDEITFTIDDRAITINETISTSDVVNIDCEEKTVEINSTEVDFTGTFPFLDVGVNTCTIEINETKNFDITISYFNNFL